MTLVASGGVLMEAGERDQLSATFLATARRVVGLSTLTIQ